MAKQSKGLNRAKQRQSRKKKKPISNNTGVLKMYGGEGTNPNIKLFVKNGELWAEMKNCEETWTSGTGNIKIEYIKSEGKLGAFYT